MRDLVQIFWDVSVPATSESKTVAPDEEYLKSLIQRCTESLSTSAVLNCKLYEAPSLSKQIMNK